MCEAGTWRDRNGPGIPDCQAVCLPECQNGGVCIRPGVCHCQAPAWEGARCQRSKGADFHSVHFFTCWSEPTSLFFLDIIVILVNIILICIIMISGAPCLSSPPTPRNGRVFCSGLANIIIHVFAMDTLLPVLVQSTRCIVLRISIYRRSKRVQCPVSLRPRLH